MDSSTPIPTTQPAAEPAPPGFPQLCPNPAIPAQDRYHGNIPYCFGCKQANKNYDPAQAAAQQALAARFGVDLGNPPGSQAPAQPSLSAPAGPSATRQHPASSLPGIMNTPPPLQATVVQPGAMIAQLQPSPFPFAGSHIARPSNTQSSLYAATQAQNLANQRIANNASQNIGAHAGRPIPSSLQNLMNRNVAGAALMEQKTVSMQMVLRRFSYKTIRDKRDERRIYETPEAIGGIFSLLIFEIGRTTANKHESVDGFNFNITNVIFSTLPNFIIEQLLPNCSFAASGPTRYRRFIEKANQLVIFTGSSFKKCKELVVLPSKIHKLFDLHDNGMHLGAKGVWNIFLVLDQDDSSYDDLHIEMAQAELQRAQKNAEVEEINRQKEAAERAQELAARERLRESLRVGREQIRL